MATKIIKLRASALDAWTTSGTISQELSPLPFTLTRLVIVTTLNTTTTTTGAYNDMMDRFFANFTLTGSKGKTYFGITDPRVYRAHSRMVFGGATAGKRQTIPDSGTNALYQFVTTFHFGVQPTKIDPISGQLVDDPFDLSGGIPPTGAGTLTLTGAYGSSTVMGSGITTQTGSGNTLTRSVLYYYGVQKDQGDAPSAYMPRAIPNWSMLTPSVAATSGAWALTQNVPAGDFLHSITSVTYRGTNTPRDNQVFNSFGLYLATQNQWPLQYGGQGLGYLDASVAQVLSQQSMRGWPPDDDNITLGIPSIAAASDFGIIHIPMWQLFSKTGSPYGADLRNVNTGDLQIGYGVNNATSVTWNMLFRRYTPVDVDALAQELGFA